MLSLHVTLRAMSPLLPLSLGACTSQFPQTIMSVHYTGDLILIGGDELKMTTSWMT